MVLKLSIGVLPLVTGCLFSDDERVAPISQFRPVTTVGYAANITFEHGGDNLDSPDCLLLEDGATVTLEGRPFERTVRGGLRDGGGCEFPQMRLTDLPELATATIEFVDSGTSIDCALGDSLVPFAIETVPPGPWQFTSGQHVTVVASQPADTTELHAVLVDPRGGHTELMVQQTASELQFTLPAGISGTQELQIVARHTITGTADYTNRCGGILFTGHHAHRTITIAP